MRVYVAVKKGKYPKYGVSAYSEAGKLLKHVSMAARHPEEWETGKFGAPLAALLYGVRKVNEWLAVGELQAEQTLTVYTSNQVVYGFVEKGAAPEPYHVGCSDLLLDLQFLPGVVSVVHAKIADQKVRFKPDVVSDGMSMGDFLKGEDR